MNRPAGSVFTWLRNFLFTDPTLGLLLVMLVVAGGIVGYRSMIKEALPDLEIPMADISTYWHGSSQTVMEKEITDRIEREIRDLDRLKRYSSGSSFANSTILVEFDSEASIQESLTQVRERVAKASAEFPKSVEKTVVSQASVRDIPIVSYVLHGPASAENLSRTAERLKREMLRIAGIKAVELYGHRKRYVRVQMLPERMRRFGISPSEIVSQIEARKQDFPLGIYEGREMPLNLKSETAIHSIDQLAGLPLKRGANGLMIYLRDIARVEEADYRPDTETYFTVEGSPLAKGIALSLQKSAGQDTIALVARATEILDQAKGRADWPKGLDYHVVSSNAEIIRQELDKTLVSGWQSALAVFLVLFFLLTWREAAISALSIPVTFLGSIAVLWALGLTFNVMVVIGMVVALGLLVDDFILMMEGMHEGIYIRRLPYGKAAMRTIRHFAVPSLAGTVTTVLIFVPLANIGGLDGKFIRTIPVTAAVCLAVSYLVSVFISVPLSRYLFPKQGGPAHSSLIDRITLTAEQGLVAWLSGRVVPSGAASMKWLGLGGLVIAAGVGLGSMLPVTLYPVSDGRNMGITVELPADYRLEESREVAERLAGILRDKPYLSSTLVVVGERDFVYEGSAEDKLSVSTAKNLIGFTILYKPKSERDHIAIDYVPALRLELEEALADVPGVRLLITSETGGSSNEDGMQINILGSDLSELATISGQVRQRLEGIYGLADVRDSLGQGKTEATIRVNREMLDLYGLSEQDFNMQLSLHLGDHKMAKMRRPDSAEDLEIRFETYWPSKNGRMGGPEDWSEWQGISVLTPDGDWIPVSLLADLHLTRVPMTVSHKNGRRNVTVMGKSFVMTYEEIQAQVDPILAEMQKGWPEGYEYRWAGEVEQAAETYGGAGKAFVLAILGLFAILVLQFRSFLQPVIILVTVVFGFAGVFYGFFLMGYYLTFTAVIGMIALAGINVNDGIVLVDTMNRHRRAGMPVAAAAARGAADRLRPIVSTTITTLAGLIPLAVADPSWRPLCAAVIFGEILSTIAAMVVIPALYRLVTRERDAAILDGDRGNGEPVRM